MTQGEPIGEHDTDPHAELMLALARVFTTGRLSGWYVTLSSASRACIKLELQKRVDEDEPPWAELAGGGSLLDGYRR